MRVVGRGYVDAVRNLEVTLSPALMGAGLQRPENYLGPQPTPKRFDLSDEIWYEKAHGSSVFLGSGTPLSEGAGPQRPQIFETS